MITECIKEGFSLANKNLQLVFIRIILTIINFISFFIFLGVPVVAAIAYLGMDIANAKDLFPFMIENPFEFVSRYLGLVFITGIAFISYITFVSLFFLYVLGGILGVLKNSVFSTEYKFSLSSFFQSAGHNFSRLFWLISLLLTGVTALVVVLIILSGIIVAMTYSLTGSESTIEIFLGSFLMTSVIIFSLIAFLICFILIAYSIVVLIIEEEGVMVSVRKAFVFLKNNPGAIIFYIILFVGILAFNLLFFGMRIPFGMLPVMGSLMNILLSLMNAFFQGYLAVFMWGSLIIYYTKSSQQPSASTTTYEI